jgi:hypothetical protein
VCAGGLDGLDMGDGKVEFGTYQGASEGGIDITHHDDHVRTVIQDVFFVGKYNPGGLGAMRSRPNA